MSDQNFAKKNFKKCFEIFRIFKKKYFSFHRSGMGVASEASGAGVRASEARGGDVGERSDTSAGGLAYAAGGGRKCEF